MSGFAETVLGPGNNTFAGTTANDSVLGQGGNDSILGIGGDDWLDGGADRDTLDGGIGNDTLDGNTGNDSLIGGNGNDSLIGGAGNDCLNGGLNDDTLDGGADNDTIFGGIDAGNDSLIGNAGTDFLNYAAATGGITIDVQAQRATLSGLGNDSITSFESYRLGSGSDSFLGSSSTAVDETVNGGAGDDRLDGGAGNDMASYANAGGAVTVNLDTGTSSGADGNDVLISFEAVIGGNSSDSLVGGNGNDTLDGGAGNGNDALVGGNGRDSLFGGSGNGNDSLFGGIGDDTLDGGNSADTLTGDAGNDRLFGGSGSDSIDGGDGNDSIFSGDTSFGRGNDTILGGSGNDYINANQGVNSSILGGIGDDTLDQVAGWNEGGDGNDCIISSPSNGTLIGGAGADTLIDLGGPDGNQSFAGSGDGTDLLTFRHFSQNPIFVDLGVGTFSGDPLSNLFGNNSISGINRVFGTIGADTLTGGSGNDTLFGEDPAWELISQTRVDSISGAGGDDWLNGGLGEDTLKGGTGNDTLEGGQGSNFASYANAGGDVTVNLATGRSSGADNIDSIANIRNVVGGNGNDFLLGNDSNNILIGGLGNDTLDGGLGSDVLDGGAGSNWASYANAGGAVTVNLGAGSSSGADNNDAISNITNVLGGNGADSLLGNSSNNSLIGGLGNDTLVGGLGNDYLDGGAGSNWASYANAGGAVTVNLGAGSSSGADDSDTILNITNVLGGNGADSLLGDGSNNRLIGGLGNDTLAGGNGDDRLDGGSGNDFASYANAGAGVDVQINRDALGGAGNDELQGFEGLIGSNFDDTLEGDTSANTLIGGGGSDSLLTGGGGNDLLDYGAGNDTFVWDQVLTPGNLTLIGADGNDFLNLGTGWVNGTVTSNDWINFERTIAGTGGTETVTMFTQGWEQVVCFAEGTRIVTPGGEDVVENLRAGDMVLAMRNGQAGFEPLRWVGFMDIAVPRNAVMAAKTAPILIKAGAIAPGMPARDLRVSPDHAMEIDGHLIPAKHLVNGSSIIQEIWCKRVRYFHLELEAHGLLLSEGTWSESYLDDGNRHAFNNAALTGLFLDFEAGRSKGEYDHMACLPVLRQGLKLDEIHGRLALRAEELARAGKGRLIG